VRSESGGTPSPEFRHLPGRLLVLHCLACGGEYSWDFFAHAGSALPVRRAPRTVELLSRELGGTFRAAPTRALSVVRPN
jgi:hypothetical protein